MLFDEGDEEAHDTLASNAGLTAKECFGSPILASLLLLRGVVG